MINPLQCWAGDLDGVAYLQKYTTLEHMQADQVAKLPSDIIYRRLVEVGRCIFLSLHVWMLQSSCMADRFKGSSCLCGCRGRARRIA